MSSEIPHWQHESSLRMDEEALRGILMDYQEAEQRILFDDYDGAIMLLDFVYNRIKPYARKGLEKPSDQIRQAILQHGHSESELLGNPFFEYTSHRQRLRYIEEENDAIKYHKLQEILKQIIDQIDKFRMYLPSYDTNESSEPSISVVE